MANSRKVNAPSTEFEVVAVVDLLTANNSLQVEQDEIQSRIDDLAKKLKNLELQEAQMNAMIGDLRVNANRILSNLDGDIKNKRVDIENAEGTLEVLQKEIDALRLESKAVLGKLGVNEYRDGKLISQIEDTMYAISRLEQEYSDKKKDLSAKLEVTMKETSLQEMEEELKSHDKVVLTQHEFDNLQALSKQVTEYAESVKHEKAKARSAKQDLNDLRVEHASLKAKLEMYENKESSHIEENNRLNQIIADMIAKKEAPVVTVNTGDK